MMQPMACVPNRRQVCLHLVGAALTAPLATAAAEAGEGTRWLPWPKGRSTPALDLPDAEGTAWRLGAQAGHPVLLNFWASWCAPCRAEMPSLAALAQQWPGPGLQVVALNFRESADTVRRMREAVGPGLLWLRDSYGEAALAWGVRSFPSSVLVNAQGRAVLTVQGALDWADPAVQQRLAGYL